MKTLFKSLQKYNSSLLINPNGETYTYSQFLCLISKYEENFSNIDSLTSKNAVLILPSFSPVHALALIIACFLKKIVVVIAPQTTELEFKYIEENYYYTYVAQHKYGNDVIEYVNSNKYYNYPDNVNFILFTSGTQGRSKGVMFTCDNLFNNIEAGVNHFFVEERSSVVCVLPVYHAFGLNIGTLALMYSGCNIFFSNSINYFHHVKTISPGYFFLTPEILCTHKKMHTLVDFCNSWGNNPKYVFCGGNFVSSELREYLDACNIKLFCSYGLTEAAPSVSAENFNFIKSGSVGKPISGVKVDIIDEEIVVSGNNVAIGYFEDWVKDKTLFNGCIKTGDLGYVDSDGFLFLTGRKKNLIIFADGQKYQAEYIEEFLSKELKNIQVLVKTNKDISNVIVEFYGEYNCDDVRNILSKCISPHHVRAKIEKRDCAFLYTNTGKIKR